MKASCIHRIIHTRAENGRKKQSNTDNTFVAVVGTTVIGRALLIDEGYEGEVRAR